MGYVARGGKFILVMPSGVCKELCTPESLLRTSTKAKGHKTTNIVNYRVTHRRQAGYSTELLDNFE